MWAKLHRIGKAAMVCRVARRIQGAQHPHDRVDLTDHPVVGAEIDVGDVPVAEPNGVDDVPDAPQRGASPTTGRAGLTASVSIRLWIPTVTLPLWLVLAVTLLVGDDGGYLFARRRAKR
ncbi:LapA family protein [Streptomyces galbus]|uniref:LapA family protein n=1 Tax=Streptomyces galbus TaxID=33898 RepID=UPI001B33DACF|nr:LapA family protein [Streptomyces galbus]